MKQNIFLRQSSRTFAGTSFLMIALIVAAFSLPVAPWTSGPFAQSANAQAAADKDAKVAGPNAAKIGTEAKVRQERVKQMMKQVEEKFRNLARELEKTEPKQAKRLIAALNKAKERLLSERMDTIVDLLVKERFDEAQEEQLKIVEDLQELVQILTEDPSELDEILREIKRLEEWKEQVNNLLDDENDHPNESKKLDDPDKAIGDLNKQIAKVKKLIDQQSAVIGNTDKAKAAGAHALGKVANQQRDVRKETEKLNKEIGKAADNTGDDKGEKPGEAGGKPGEAGGKPGEAGGRPGDAGGKPGEAGGDQPGQKELAKAASNQKAAKRSR